MRGLAEMGTMWISEVGVRWVREGEGGMGGKEEEEE